MNTCPDKNWKSIDQFKNEKYLITKLTEDERSESFICKNLDMYKIQKNFAKENQDADWGELYVYVGIQREEKNCNLVLSKKYVGPFLSEENSLVQLEGWREEMAAFAKKLLTDTNLHIDEASLKSSVIRDRKKYRDWCTGFPAT